ncbi:hypothetical protein KL921_005278 [Ogataea angusta]|uniref:LOG family protein n=1 Tax=Pichia angusta TaxID=870730 RepID=A0AAN6DI64_PICAN|nr:uncharacterized protein KL928_001445 [Ogataea angusta]KAG7805847.1 hypothetical protein KL921_005278 [Ogataea angusta]KAG7817099.1 hypothetical protein KL909_005348 [Ogataea angusta]KAG7820008.1 hypothetical protein KL928_001445 [Ogataea angusta]KAG7829381.1 hypothetical protein KL920_002240 [Ogataea angusta]KAG7835380.1 hypothetical protein KL942_005319 [Ogataea angusta]
MTVNPRKTICVFCGSSFGKEASYSQAATELGNLLAAKDYGLVYGGGTTGLMGLIAKSVASKGGYVHGIIPDALVSKERTGSVDEINKKIQSDVDNHKGETPLDDSYGRTTIVSDMHTRKRMMGMEADGGFVAMPGGFGTLEEIMEVTTWSQLGIHQKPVVLFNVDGFYDDFIKFLSKAVEAGFISKNNSNIVAVASTPEEVIEKLDNYVVPDGRFNLTWKNH